MSKIPKTASGRVALIHEMLADPAMNLALRSVLAAQEAFGGGQGEPSPQTVDEVNEAQGPAMAATAPVTSTTPITDAYRNYKGVLFDFGCEVQSQVQSKISARVGDDAKLIGITIHWAHETRQSTRIEYTVRLGDERTRWEDVSGEVSFHNGEESVTDFAELVAKDIVMIAEGWLKTRAEKAYREASSKASVNRASSAQTGQARLSERYLDQARAQSLAGCAGMGQGNSSIRLEGTIGIRKD